MLQSKYLQAQTGRHSLIPIAGHYVPQQSRENKLIPVLHSLTTIQGGHFQDIFDQMSQAIRLLLQDMDIVFNLFRLSLAQEASIDLHIGHRCAQFVSDVGHELSPGLLQLFALANVRVAGHIPHWLSLNIVHRGNGQHRTIRAAVFAADTHLTLPGFAPRQGRARGELAWLEQCGPEQRMHMFSQGILLRVTGQGGIGFVDILNPHIEISHHDGIAHAVENRLCLSLLGADFGRASDHSGLQALDQAGVLYGNGGLNSELRQQDEILLGEALPAAPGPHVQHPQEPPPPLNRHTKSHSWKRVPLRQSVGPATIIINKQRFAAFPNAP